MQLVAELWESVNVTVHPELRTRAFRRELNVVHCETCHNTATLPAPLLYHDVTLRLAVQYMPAEALSDPRRLAQFKPDGSIDAPPQVAQFAATIAYLMAPHVVFSIDELLRYVEFREALAGYPGDA